jgi:hypothetical protein
MLAAEDAIVNNFQRNDILIFADLVRPKRSLDQKFHKFLKFKCDLLNGPHAERDTSEHPIQLAGHESLRSYGTAIIAVTFWNYLINKHLS